jgi:arylsulfatase A
MSRFVVSSMLGLVAALIAAGSVTAAAPAKPNIIFILADDIGLPGFGCTGGIFKTPNIDALAAGGTRFEYCYAAPLCGPSRAMLMTGRYAFRTGVTTNKGGSATPQKDGCVAKQLKDAGYITGIAGKWRQLSHFTTKEDGAKWGFDEFMIWGEADEDEAGKKSKNSRYWDPAYNLNGKTLQDTKGKFGPDLLQDFALDFIRRHKDESFFLYYPTPLIHSPLGKTPDSPAAAVKDNGAYAQNVAYLDKQVGQIAAELDKLKLREKTLIVFTGDNGSVGAGTVNGQKVDGGKSTMLEGGSRVALIANWPGTTPAGVVKKDLVVFTDMLPTFLELGDGKPAEGIKIDGQSFAPQVRGETGTPREWIYMQLGNERYVRDPRWKLTGTGALFDMKEAPFKQILVPESSTDADAKAARERLKTELNKLLASAAGDAAGAPPKKKKKKNQ